MTNYIGVVHKERGSEYSISFPDFPGCVTAGKTIDEAKDMAQEALSFHIDGMLEDGATLPEPSLLEEVAARRDCAGGVAFLVVSIPEQQTQAVRVNITVPETVLRKIDAAARKRGMSRSAFLVQAARKILAPVGQRAARH